MEKLDGPAVLMLLTSHIVSRTEAARLHTSRDQEENQGLSLMLGRAVGVMQEAQGPLCSEELEFYFVGEKGRVCEDFSKECRTIHI